MAFAAQDDGGAVKSEDQPNITVGIAPISHPSQDKILSDGSVTHDEMEQALLAVVACLKDAGYDATLASFRSRMGYQIDLHADNKDEAVQQKQDSDYNRCEATYLGMVLDVYAREHRPSQAEIEAREAEVMECMRDGASATSSAQTIDELRVEVGEEVYTQCDLAIDYPAD